MEKLPVKINEVIKNSNITDLTKAEEIASHYAPFLGEVSEQIKLLKKLKKGNAEDAEKAKRIRLDLGKICSRTGDLKKKDKEFLLIQTRFVDALFNTVEGAARITQEEAKEIENHFELIEQERIEKLFVERNDKLLVFMSDGDIVPANLGEMPEEQWKIYLKGAETGFEEKKLTTKRERLRG